MQNINIFYVAPQITWSGIDWIKEEKKLIKKFDKDKKEIRREQTIRDILMRAERQKDTSKCKYKIEINLYECSNLVNDLQQ